MEGTIIWRVLLFDGPVLEDASGDQITRFKSAKVQSLLAFVALRLGKRCSREELAEALWPEESDERVVANRLRVALASLRRQLEPPGVLYGSVLDASIPGCIRLREETVWCDVASFEKLYARGNHHEAAALARGALLPGTYDDWARSDQIRLDILIEELRGRRLPPRIADEVPLPLPQSRLPLYLTKFFGREAERDEVIAKLSAHRLVTLTGPGGMGKTRLSVETARAFDLPAVFAALAEVTDPSLLPEAVLQSMGVEARAVGQLDEAVQRRGPMLLILDNVEQIVEAAAELSLRLLQSAPDLRILVTSRQRLEVAGEVVIGIQPLAPPPDSTSEAQLTEFPSAKLFLDRAKAALPDFILLPHHVGPVIEICRKLDGVPLALELAAARVTAQSPAQIAISLAENLMELKSRQRGLSVRHRSLRAAIQGSFDQLSAESKEFFAALSVFHGGWTADAARAITLKDETRALLEELVIRSLVLVKEDADTVRFSFLETIRSFADEQLSPEQHAVDRRRHASYFLNLAALVDEDDLRTCLPLDAEQQNLAAALEGERRDAYWNGLPGALVHAYVRGHHRAAARWIDDSMPYVDAVESDLLRFKWRYAAGLILPDIGRFQDAEWVAEAIRLDKTVEGRAYADVLLGYVRDCQGKNDEAVKFHRTALGQARKSSNRHLLEACLSNLSGTLHNQSLRLGTESEEGWKVLPEAEALARELIDIVPENSRRKPLAHLLLAAALSFQNRKREAYACYEETERIAIRLGTMTELMYSFLYESEILAAFGFGEEAATLYGAFLALQSRMGYSISRAETSRLNWIHDIGTDLREKLGTDRYVELINAGGAKSHSDLAELTVQLPDSSVD